MCVCACVRAEVSEEVDTSDLRAEVKQLITENDSLTQDIDLLTDENEHLTKGCIIFLYVHFMTETFFSSD